MQRGNLGMRLSLLLLCLLFCAAALAAVFPLIPGSVVPAAGGRSGRRGRERTAP